MDVWGSHRLVPSRAGHVDALRVDIAREDADSGGTRVLHETSVLGCLSYQIDG
jgi:hypothetical protein